MTPAQYRALPKAKKTKYGNRKVVTSAGLKFDSVKEERRWMDLEQLESYGEINDLRRQVVFHLTVNGMAIGKYIIDFTYNDGGKYVVEDVKSVITKKNPVYRLKKKLMLAIYGIELLET